MTTEIQDKPAEPQPELNQVAEEAQVPLEQKEWGPYDNPNYLIVDLLKQARDIEFKNTFETNAKYKAQSFQKAQSHIHHWPEPIVNAKKAEKEIGGIGKAVGAMIEEILANKCLVYKDETLHPIGDVKPPTTVKPIEDLAKGGKKKKADDTAEPKPKRQRQTKKAKKQAEDDQEDPEEEEEEPEEEEEEQQYYDEPEDDYEETESEPEPEDEEDDYKPTKKGGKKAPAKRTPAKRGRKKKDSDDD